MSRVSSFLFASRSRSCLSGCKHVPTEKERQSAEIHYDLGVQAQQDGNMQEALQRVPARWSWIRTTPRRTTRMGVLLHLSFRRPAEAIEHYQKALEVRPTFSEARTNLANVYLDQGRYDEAIKLYEQVLNDMLYPTPYIAQGNLGWAFTRRATPSKALENIKAAVTLNPNFCLGFKNLGLIYEQTGSTDEACTQFAHYREQCPDVRGCVHARGRVSGQAGPARTAAKRALRDVRGQGRPAGDAEGRVPAPARSTL